MNPTPEHRRHLAAVVFVDVVGYTALAAHREDRALELVEAFQALTRETIGRFGGEVVKFMGDGALAVFDSTDRAVRAVVALQAAFAERSAEIGTPSQLHAGVHLGEIVTTPDGDAYGDGVNTASRLQGVAEPGQVAVSEDVWRQLGKRDDFVLEYLGTHELKGLARPIGVYQAGLAPGVDPVPDRPVEDTAPVRAPEGVKEPSPAPRGLARIVIGFATLVVVVIVVIMTQVIGEGERESPTTVEEAALPADRSIAVLPFENLSSDPENEHFGDGMTEDIITRLAKIGDLKVISRMSAMRYRGTDKSLKEVAAELGVATVLEGSVRRSGDRVRIVAQLIDAETDVHLWAETYDRGLADIFAIQADVAAKIAGALHATMTLGQQERVAAAPTADLVAYRLYQEARLHWSQRTQEGLQAAIDLFRTAIARDPEYALAWLGLAQTYAILPNYSFDPLEEHLDAAKESALKAIALDPEVGEAHAVLGWLARMRWEWEDAEREFHRALELAPGDATSHHWYAWYLSCVGRFDDAIAEIRTARELDPMSRVINSEVGLMYFHARRFDDAMTEFRNAVEMDPDYGRSYLTMAWVYELTGRIEEAIDARERYAHLSLPSERLENELRYLEALRQAFAEGGERAYWEGMLARSRETENPRPLDFVGPHAQLGSADEAFRSLEEMYIARDPDLSGILVNPYLDRLHSDPRFRDLVERMGLEMVEIP